MTAEFTKILLRFLCKYVILYHGIVDTFPAYYRTKYFISKGCAFDAGRTSATF